MRGRTSFLAGGECEAYGRESEASSTWRGFTRPEAKSERRGTEGVLCAGLVVNPRSWPSAVSVSSLADLP